MPGLIKDIKKSVSDYKGELFSLKSKTLAINKSVCNIDDVISSIQSSTQTQEEKIASLDNFSQNSEQFITDTVRIDSSVAEIVKKRKDDFYDKYSYLKPECEKNGWERFKDDCKKVGQWCEEHWKLIVTIAIVIVAVVCLFIPGVNAFVLGLLGPIFGPILMSAFTGALWGVGIGGLMGGLSSMATGGSFWEGFENGAFSGAITGLITGGLGGVCQVIGSSCTVATALGNSVKVINTIANISTKISLGMFAFDALAVTSGVIFGNDNFLTAFNLKLHSSKLYNGFQIGIGVVSLVSSSFSRGLNSATCFVAGTMILTAAGLVAIENIKAGDKVVSTNVDTFETNEKEVLEAFSLVHIWIDDKKTSVTPNHPYGVSDKGWVEAGDLVIGEQLKNSNGELIAIQKIEHEELCESVTVYNFKVDDYHTYYAGDISILVHNSNCAPRKPIKGVTNTEVHEDGSVTYTKIINGQEVKVTYNSDGYPDFSPYAHPDHPNPVKIEYSGNRITDTLRANQQAGLSSKPTGYTWHHMQDGQSMMLVNETIHGAKFGFPHTGGFSINQITN